MRIAILGAGCAGGSLAYQLVRRGFRGELYLVDSRDDFSQEQRWCSWGPLDDDLAPLVSASWARWAVISPRGAAHSALMDRPYRQIYAPDFYRHIFGALERYPNVSMRLGVAAHGVEETARGLRVATSEGPLLVDQVFDSRHTAPAPRQERARSAAPPILLHQTFVGQVVRTEGAAFDPATATLMDFRTPQPEDAGIAFIYVLPYGADRALVESTIFAPSAVAHGEHRRRGAEYLARRGVARYAVEAEEHGDLIMTTARYPARISPRHMMIGTAGGALRPSSGYGFLRIQRQARAIAEAVVRGRRIPTATPAPKYRLLDPIFLDVLRQSPEVARESFMRMFSRAPAASLVRFLSEESAAFDDLAVVWALPKLPYMRAAFRRAIPARRARVVPARVGA